MEAYSKHVRTKQECKNTLEEAQLNLKIFQGDIEDSIQAKAVKTASKVYGKATDAVTLVTGQIFLHYSNLLSEGAKEHWD